MNIEPHRLPEGWVSTTFGEIFDFKGGSQPPKSDFANEPRQGFIRLLQIRDFGTDKFPVYIKDSPRWPKCEVDDVLIARYGASLGRVLTGMEGAYNVALVKMIFDRENIDSKWTRYLLNSRHFQEPIHLLSRSAQNGFNKNEVDPIDIALPPLNEQRRIVAKIEALQERSRKAREALAEVGPLLEQFRQSLLAAAFRGDLTADWRAANPNVEPASELLNRIRQERRQKWEQSELDKYESKAKQPPKDWRLRYQEPPPVKANDLPALPESWAWATVDELMELITSGSRAWSKYYDKGDGTFIMAQNVRPGRLDFSKERQLIGPPPEPDSDRKRSQVEPGDLLVTIVGANTGDICPVEKPLPEHWVCQSVALLRLVLPEMYGLVLRYFLPGGGGRARFDEVIYGQGRPHLGFDDLRTMPVPIPPLEEQSELLRVIGAREESIDAVQAVLTESESALTQLDQSILAKAFRGELVAQDPNDEPASVLLERIRDARQSAAPTKSSKRKDTANGRK